MKNYYGTKEQCRQWIESNIDKFRNKPFIYRGDHEIVIDNLFVEESQTIPKIKPYCIGFGSIQRVNGILEEVEAIL